RTVMFRSVHMLVYTSFLITCVTFSTNTASPTPCSLSLHDALPISSAPSSMLSSAEPSCRPYPSQTRRAMPQLHLKFLEDLPLPRSEEHTSELQSRFDLVCRLLLEKKKRTNITRTPARSATDSFSLR